MKYQTADQINRILALHKRLEELEKEFREKAEEAQELSNELFSRFGERFVHLHEQAFKLTHKAYPGINIPGNMYHLEIDETVRFTS